MSARRLAALLPLAAILLLGGVTTPAGAVVVPMVAPDPVSNLVVGTVTQGANQSWVIPFSWQASDGATGYTVKVTNLDGTEDYNTTKDVTGTSATVTTPNLADGNQYEVSVAPKNADGDGTAVTAQFAAPALDRTAPTGTYTVSPTQAWLNFDFANFDANEKASVTVKQLSLSDDSGGAVSRQVLAGDGSSAVAWPSGTSLAITYNRAGTFTPQVKLTDEFGNVGTVSLNPVTVSDDNAAPVVRVTRPAASMRERIAGWRVIRGTATDVGTGVDKVLVFVLQKRGGLWYVYHFRKRVWLKGRSTQAATLSHVKARPALLSTDSVGRWHTKWIRGLKTGKLVVHTAAFDQVLNIGLGPVVRQKITRR